MLPLAETKPIILVYKDWLSTGTMCDHGPLLSVARDVQPAGSLPRSTRERATTTSSREAESQSGCRWRQSPTQL